MRWLKKSICILLIANLITGPVYGVETHIPAVEKEETTDEIDTPTVEKEEPSVEEIETNTPSNEQVVTIYLDQQPLPFETSLGKPYIDEANRTQIPFRGVLEAFGATVDWDEEKKEAVALKDGIEVRVPIGRRYITKNHDVIFIDTAAVIIEGRTYIPARAVLEAFDAIVEWDGESYSVLIQSPPPPLVISRLPVYYDLRERNALAKARNQLDIGACWAFATLGAIESCLSPEQLYDFSEDHISLSHGYDFTQDEGGDFQISLAYLSRWSGPVFEVDDPYGDGIFNEGLEAAVHVQEAIIIPEKDYQGIKRAILMYGGVQTSIHIRDIESNELGDAFNDITNAFYYENGDVQPNHDVVIVGWDDEFSRENFNVTPNRDGAFICRNSYGDTFGNDGYFYVSYDDDIIGRENIVYSRIDNNDNYDKIYQSDWLGWVGRIGFGKDTAYFSNVYTVAEEVELLEAVSFYATDPDTIYEIYVVENYIDSEDFNDMNFISRGTLDYAGYYTIDFEIPIEISGDFAVVVKVMTPGSTYPVAAEYSKDVEWLNNVNIDDGRGFMSYDGKTWESTEEVLQSNVCLKAFTSVLVIKDVPDVDVQEEPKNEEQKEVSEDGKS